MPRQSLSAFLKRFLQRPLLAERYSGNDRGAPGAMLMTRGRH